MSSAALSLSFSSTAFLCNLQVLQPPLSQACSIAKKNKLARGSPAKFSLLLRLKSINVKSMCKTRNEACKDVFQKDNSPGIERHEILLPGDGEGATAFEIKEKIKSIRSMLGSIEDGEISISAYSTAWVSLVEDINGSGVPQLPSSLQWVVDNQLPDGSWGDRKMFSAYDRMLNTLACVISLKSWNVCQEVCEKGVVFIRENISKLECENKEEMFVGFEILFPSLLEIARRHGLQVPRDSPVLQELHAKANLKFTKIPMDMIHRVHTTVLHSLEGMAGHNLDWEKLLKLQCQDGSFLFSPSPTAFAFMQTKDDRCLKYLTKIVEKFIGGVPEFYPLDLQERNWAVDRLERLGISRHFQLEIKECLNYVYRYWTERGIGWARDTVLPDIDSTSMGFRLLRLHGYEVSPGSFWHFEKDGEFFVFAGQLNQSITAICNLYRTSQILFPGEKILEEAKAFATKFLSKKQASGSLVDKWVITKDLPGEVAYALDIPWYASLPRIEARFYIQHYGGDDDAWIGKTLYKMPNVNNNNYLELAKLDFNYCQAFHQLEWTTIIQKWYEECNLGELGVGRRELLQAYFVAAASIFEPERVNERLAWARVVVLIKVVYLNVEMDTNTSTAKLLNYFNNSNSSKTKKKKKLIDAILTTLNCIAQDTLVAHQADIGQHLQSAWNNWLQYGREGEGELLVRMINLCAGCSVLEEQLSHPQYQRFLQLINVICCHLHPHLSTQGPGKKNNVNAVGTSSNTIEALMQELVQLVLQNTDGIDSRIKRLFLTIAKSFYYAAHCTGATIDQHIAKVLFEKVA